MTLFFLFLSNSLHSSTFYADFYRDLDGLSEEEKNIKKIVKMILLAKEKDSKKLLQLEVTDLALFYYTALRITYCEYKNRLEESCKACSPEKCSKCSKYIDKIKDREKDAVKQLDFLRDIFLKKRDTCPPDIQKSIKMRYVTPPHDL